MRRREASKPLENYLLDFGLGRAYETLLRVVGQE